MPVTLCFIKDKHKVMEHKIPLETYFAGLLQKVEWQIQEYEDTAADTLTLCRLCVDYLQEILGERHKFESNFTDFNFILSTYQYFTSIFHQLRGLEVFENSAYV